ncbi:MAG: deferrochelatase/peroxidase EfeB [Neisseriaceae bacterium]|nr:deferrochelatase/peroxidase EfeB [Neisseriaceae bacterium]
MSEQKKASAELANPSRRQALKGLGLAGGGLVVGAVGGYGWFNRQNDAKPASAADPTVGSLPFKGEHQSGIVDPEQQEAIFIAFTVVAKDKAAVAELFHKLSDRIAFLTQGGEAPTRDGRYPPPESGILGEYIHPDGLSITASVGASFFDERYGLAAHRPKQLIEMPSFPNDALDASWCDGDLLLQLCANSRETVIYAVRDLVKTFSGRLVAQWKMDGFLPARDVRNGHTPINLFGFKDGTGNAPGTDNKLMDELVWVNQNSGEPAWAVGGSYHVVRLIRFFLEFWDRTPLGEQEIDFGRQKASGAALGQKAEFDDPAFDQDPEGKVTPYDSHMRRAEPRDPHRYTAKLRRRSYSYSLGLTKSSQLDMGLIFVCFQQDLNAGFVSTQKRLDGEPLEEYIKPFGGGYYFALPGITDDRYLGQALFEAA